MCSTPPHRRELTGAREPIQIRDWLLHVLILWQFAFAQPLYAVLSRGATFFVAHSFSPAQLVAFAATVSFALPLALASLVLPLRALGPAALRAGQATIVAGLVGLATAAALSEFDAPAAGVLAAAAAAGAVSAVTWARWQRLREFLRFAALASLVFPINFLLFSPVRELVLAPFALGSDGRTISIEHRDVPVFLILFDEFTTVFLVDERGKLDTVNFPNFARLAARATWFRNATANSTSTEVAVSSVLTGRNPDRDLPPTAAGHPTNLFTLLAPPYDLVAFEHLARLCPEELCHPMDSPSLDFAAAANDLWVVARHVLTPKRLRVGLPALEGRWSGFAEREPSPLPAGESPVEAGATPSIPFGRAAKPHFDAFLDTIDRDARGRFFFLHSLLPHVPYVFLPDGRSYAANDRFDTLPGWTMSDNLWAQDGDLVAHGYQRALLQAQMVDGLVGRLLDRLEELALFDDALLVITSDHGVNFLPGLARRGFNDRTLGTGLMVPLFVKTPGQRKGALSDRNVQSIDIAPTIVDVIGETPEGVFDGVSVFDRAREPKVKWALPWRGPMKMLLADVTPYLLRDAAAKHALFRVQHGVPDFYGVEPFSELVGRPLGDFELGPAQPVTASLAAPERFGPRDPAGAFVPAAVEGRFEVDAGEWVPPYVAIGVNGRLGAVAKLYTRHGESRFHGIVDPALLDPVGGDEITLYSIAGDRREGEPPRLYPLRGSVSALPSSPAPQQVEGPRGTVDRVDADRLVAAEEGGLETGPVIVGEDVLARGQ